MAFSKTKKMKKGLLSCVLAVSMVTGLVPLNAVSVKAAQEYTYGETDDGFSYRVNAGGNTVTINGHKDGTSLSGELIIPDYVNIGDEKLPVTTVNGFSGYNNITSVKFPNTVTVIGGFARCTSLKGELVIPKSVTQIYTNSFQDCTSIEKVTFEKGSQLERLGGGSFRNCSKLRGDIKLPATLKSITFNYEYEKPVFADCGLDGILEIPATMTSEIITTGNIFKNIINKSEVKVSVLNGINAEIYCYRNEQGEESEELRKGNYTLSYKDGVKEIGDYTVSVSGNDATILAYNGEGIQDLTIPQTITDGSKVLNITKIGNYAFTQKNITGKLTIPEGITSIGDYAFSELDGLTGDINIPDTVTSIGSYAFNKCKGFDGKLKLSSNLTQIGDNAFMSCDNLTGDLYIPDSVIEMGEWAFGGCKKLTGSLHISKGLTSISDYSLSQIGCSGDLIIPEGVTSIGKCAFRYDSGFDGILSLPDSLESVTSEAFSSVRFCGELVLPENLNDFYGGFSDSLFTKVINKSQKAVSVGRFSFNKNVRYILSGDETETTVTQIEAGKTYDVKCDISKATATVDGKFFRATGSEIKPEVNVSFLNKDLEKGKDYDLSYSNNILPGTAAACITITGKGIFEGEQTINFTIANEDAVNIEDDEKFSVEVAKCTYNGQAQTPKVTVTYDGNVLVENSDYTVEGYSNNTHAYEKSEVTIKGSGDKYSGVYKKKFNIQPLDLNDEDITVSDVEDVNYFNYYGRRAAAPVVKFKDSSISSATKGAWNNLKSGYYMSYENTDKISTDEEKAAIVMEGFGDFTGTRRAYYNVLKLNLADEKVTITLDFEEKDYTGETFEPGFKITYGSAQGGIVNIDKSNVNVVYAANSNAGKATVTLEGKGNCEGSVTKEFTITPVNISSDENIVINEIKPLDYAKTELKPEVVILFNNKKLKKDKDFSVKYVNNIKTGKAQAIVTGKGNFSGEKKITFVINKGDISKYKVSGIANKTYNGQAIKQKITLSKNSVTLKEGTDYKVTYSNNVKAGTATVKITGIGQFEGTISKQFKINAKKITPNVTLKATSFVYTGKVITPAVTVKYGKTVLKKGTDYTVTYAAGRKNVGRYNVTVKLKGNYSGNKMVTFDINPKGTSINKLTRASKAITAKWTAITAKMATSVISGYQIQLSTNAKYTAGNKTVNVTGAKVSSKNITKLAGNKKYYVRIRTFKKIGKITFYSSWSKTYNVTTAK